MEKEEYVKPLTSVLRLSAEDLLDFRISDRTGDEKTGPLAKPYDFEEDEEVEPNKWGTTLPTSVPDAWKSVGE